MHFIYKWLKNGRFPYRVVEEARRAVVVALFAAAEIMPAENPFPSTFPTFVPSLSWYIDRFLCNNGSKSRCAHRLAVQLGPPSAAICL